MEQLFFLAIGILISFAIGCIGEKRKIGFGWAFGLSLVNLLLGLIVTLCSSKKNKTQFLDIEKED